MTRFLAAVCTVAAAIAVGARGHAQRPVTIDDLMALRTIVDVEIAPAGDRVAYVVSTPSVAANAHESAIFVVPRQPAADSRQPRDPAPVQLGSDVKVFTPALPAPRLRWSPDGSLLSFLGVSDGPPQVFATTPSGGTARALTSAPQGVIAYEWAPDGKSLAYLTREPAPTSLVTQVDAPQPATRLWLQLLKDVTADSRLPTADALTPTTYHVDSFSWSPDGREIVYSATSAVGFTAPYYTRLYRVPPARRSRGNEHAAAVLARRHPHRVRHDEHADGVDGAQGPRSAPRGHDRVRRVARSVRTRKRGDPIVAPQRRLGR